MTLDVFDFQFTVKMSHKEIARIANAIGMSIGDDDYERDLGQGYVAPGVRIRLVRGDVPDEWTIEARSRTDDYDRGTVDRAARQIRTLLKEFADDWTETRSPAK
jgi:hypothetical protein